jgi:hypothetical protein
MTTHEKADQLFEENYSIIEKFCFDNYRDMLAKQLSIQQVERILALPVVWMDVRIETCNPQYWDIEGTEEFWEIVKLILTKKQK